MVSASDEFLTFLCSFLVKTLQIFHILLTFLLIHANVIKHS